MPLFLGAGGKARAGAPQEPRRHGPQISLSRAMPGRIDAKAAQKRRGPRRSGALTAKETGGDLLSQALAGQVPSALRGLTALFGMGRGVSPSP
jgi:hypothetical protein